MTQVKKRKNPTKVEEIPVIPAGRLRGQLRRRIRRYEQRYEMSTNRMREVVREDPTRETLEICEWLMDDNLLKYLTGEESMDGSPSTGTSQPMSERSNGTPSSSKT